MAQKVQATYDGNKLRFDSLKDEIVFKNGMLSTIRSYTNCRAKYLIEQRHLPAAIFATDMLRHFTGAYQNHGILAVAKRCLALQNQLYVLMPSPTGYMAHWCTKIETLLKISQAIVNDESYYLYRERYGCPSRFGESPENRTTAH
jgi:hypothetical protein